MKKTDSPTGDPLNDLSDDEKAALVELAESAAKPDVGRRELLQAAGILGLGTFVGGVAGTATANSTADEDDCDFGKITVKSIGYDLEPHQTASAGFPDFIPAGGQAGIEIGPNTEAFGNTRYRTIREMTGAIQAQEIPPDMSIYGNFHMFLQTDDPDETVFARPRLWTGAGGRTAISELEVQHTGNSEYTVKCSGWQEITSISTDRFIGFTDIQTKVTAGTGRVSQTVMALHLAASRGDTG